VLSDRMEDRHVREGSLGCANCRSVYPIRNGEADLRYAGCEELVYSQAAHADPDRAVRVAALLGVTRPNTTILLLERNGATAAGVAPVIPDVHVVAGSGDEPSEAEYPPLGILSRVRLGGSLPFRGGSLAGLAAVGVDVGKLLPEVRRVLRPDGRMVAEGGTEDLAAKLRDEGFEVHLEQDGVVVASTLGRS
jgi:hypothetical protein